jgi:hypothetical protein
VITKRHESICPVCRVEGIPLYIPDSYQYRVKNNRCRIGVVIYPDDGHIFARNMKINVRKTIRNIVHQVVSIYKIIQGCTVNKT